MLDEDGETDNANNQIDEPDGCPPINITLPFSFIAQDTSVVELNVPRLLLYIDA